MSGNNVESPIPERPLAVTLVQNSAGCNASANLARIDDLLADAPPGDLLALPEVFSIRGRDEDYRTQAEILPGPVIQHLAGLAVRRREWVLAGSVMEKAGDAVFNTSVLIARDGQVTATYRKIHLFEAYLDDGQVIRESDTYRAGDTPTLAAIEGWRCGLAICYDLRFPELFRHYAGQGAHLFFMPSNFTQKTGHAHWETLLRARAIENQAFVVAPNQCGSNPCTNVASYGHSLMIGPWGDVLAQAGDEECVLRATLDPADLVRTRSRIPVLQHRRLK
ncbi:MAG: carbon-nitrogen hydrolase family protein [Verrucomicrobia bacterium]|nr:carbon-nitrogen hydrolase family protein [Verrucomicrobiota bacterium]MCG2681971.1 carbon-nitrogen hydrolase family protein [Kiritimatiellia bacterium]MBU4248447.1 carbon-nitrogen hydrolase family protein [Verrucomicrobiota bacterium]MBU4292349.1 carbon-nitrogen hydrolase family protein [Verrucomicrobiota bacterium]MBU4430022.1 carbon-nitrogen hydrolase family protein [Verrucomicrobiota bacterium]